MLSIHGKYLLDDAKKICARNNISLIENKDGTYFVDGKLTLTLKEMLSEVYKREAKI